MVLEGFLAEAVKGLFRGSQSRTIRFLKTTAWFCIGASIVSFAIAAWNPGRAAIEVPVIVGLFGLISGLTLGFAASVVHQRRAGK